jgi:hypothetical protein
MANKEIVGVKSWNPVHHGVNNSRNMCGTFLEISNFDCRNLTATHTFTMNRYTPGIPATGKSTGLI